MFAVHCGHCRVNATVVLFCSCMQQTGSGSCTGGLPGDGDAPVGEGVPHVVGTIQGCCSA